MKRKRTKEDEERIAQLLTHICVSARITCHIQWEMQYLINELIELGVDVRRIEKIKNKVFDTATDMKVVLQSLYDENIPWFDKSQKAHDVMWSVFDFEADGLLETDLIIKNEAERVYDIYKLDFDNFDEEKEAQEEKEYLLKQFDN